MSRSVLSDKSSIALDTYVVDIAWAPDSSAFAVAGGEGAVMLVEGVDGKPTSRVLGEHGMGAIAVTWQPGSKVVASSGQDSAVVLWDTAGDASAAKRVRPGVAWTEHLAFSPDGKLLATATGKVASLWSPSGELVHKFEPQAATLASLVWDKPGRDLAAATQGGVCVFRVEPPAFSARQYSWSAACLTSAFSPNGKILVTGTQDGTVHFWNLATGKDSQMRGYASKVSLTEWSADSRFLATASGNDVIVWNFAGRGPEGSRPFEFQGHTDRVSALAFHPTGPYLVSAGRDWRLSLWYPGKETIAVDAHLAGGEITSMRWSPDGKLLAVGESKGRVTLYELIAAKGGKA